MEGRIKILSLLLLIIASLQHVSTALIEARKVLHIPEKIIGGVIDIVQSHKNKPSQVYQQGQLQAQQAYVQQYAPWNPTANNPSTAYQSQNQAQFQGQGQYVNYGSYPSTGVTYPQGSYSVNAGQVYSPGSGYGGSQNQGQYQGYPQNQQTFQGQNQQTQFLGQHSSGNFPGLNQQEQFQGHNQQTNQFSVTQQNQIQGQNQQGLFHGQGQFQGQNQQANLQGQTTGQFSGQNLQTGQFSGGSHQSSEFSGQNHQTSQLSGQNNWNNQFQGQIPLSGQGQTAQNGGFQEIHHSASSGHQPAGFGPGCVCQAWTKPKNDVGEGMGKAKELQEQTEKKP